MRGRDFVAGLGGTAVWPLATWALQGERVRRIGVLMPFAESDPQAQAYFTRFVQKLAKLGLTDGSNLRMDVRCAASVDRMRTFAKELVELQHDVILTGSTPGTAAVGRLQATARVGKKRPHQAHSGFTIQDCGLPVATGAVS